MENTLESGESHDQSGRPSLSNVTLKDGLGGWRTVQISLVILSPLLSSPPSHPATRLRHSVAWLTCTLPAQKQEIFSYRNQPAGLFANNWLSSALTNNKIDFNFSIIGKLLSVLHYCQVRILNVKYTGSISINKIENSYNIK